MDFFKSVFSDDAQCQFSDPPTDPNPNPNPGSRWSFGGLMRTLADKSESVMESYRKDLEDFGSGLKKETEIIRSVASQAVNDSLEIGASVAQEKLESVGQAIDDIGSSVWKSTAQIIAHGKDTFLSPSDDDNSDSENANREEEEDLSWDIDEDDEEESRNSESEKKNDLTEDGEKWLKNEGEKADSCKDSDVSVVSSNLSMPEEEGWDEIEEIRSSDGSKGEDVGSGNRVDLRKRMIVAEEEEDLSWDIDDEEEDRPVKA
ncbi:hypothetical protein QQP08_012445 [Theobroma cacao]|nr:hypothetical protein QQP08_012445 [Theobroma cacao]